MKRERYKVDLKGMLADCEANYARLLQLFPDIMSAAERRLGLGDSSSGDSNSVLVFSVLERTPYTTLVEMTEVHAIKMPGSGTMRPPKIKVRLYHDAKLAEVTTCQRVNYIQSKHAYPNEHMVQPDEKFQWNHFLGEWLAHCSAHGYALEEECLPLY
ncbi:MAG: DUF1249 domain-containing protein [Porticoccaceae bacterium]|nr:DUF1249 domain-containing protein [Porticoccaceae bacterium]